MEAALIDQTITQLETWLSEALVARHEILTGRRATYIAHQGTQRAYKVDSLSELDQYIGSLKGALQAKLTGDTLSRRPIHPGFGFSS
jgi:hypothetical protein